MKINVPGEKPALYNNTVPSTKAYLETLLVGHRRSSEELAAMLLLLFRGAEQLLQICTYLEVRNSPAEEGE